MDTMLCEIEQKGMTMEEETVREACELLDARAAFYRMLSSLYFTELSEEGIESISNKGLDGVSFDDEAIDEGFREIADYLSLRDGSTRQELAVDFAGSILAAGSYEKRCATPYESVFTSESGLLMQDARDDVYRIFCESHLEVEESLRMPEDHLSFELEFMARQSEECSSLAREGKVQEALAALSVQKSFLERHLLNWIDDYCDCLDEVARTGFYKGVSKITRGFVKADEGSIEDIALALGR